MGPWRCPCLINGHYTKQLFRLYICGFTAESPGKCTDLAVEAQKQQHDEEEDGPEGWQRHHGHSFWVGDEGQARTWRENRVGMGRRVEGES